MSKKSFSRRLSAIAAAIGVSLAATVASFAMAAPAQAGDTYYFNGVSSTVSAGTTSYTQRVRYTSTCANGTKAVRDWTAMWTLANVSASGKTVKSITISASFVSGTATGDLIVGRRWLMNGPDFGGYDAVHGSAGFSRTYNPNVYIGGQYTSFKVDFEEVFTSCAAPRVWPYTFELVG